MLPLISSHQGPERPIELHRRLRFGILSFLAPCGGRILCQISSASRGRNLLKLLGVSLV
jgi:hypothetical protein